MTQQQLWKLTTFLWASLRNVKSSFICGWGIWLNALWQDREKWRGGGDPQPVCKFPRCSWDDLWFTSVNRMLLCMTFCCYSSLVFQFQVPGALSLRGQLHSDLPVSLNKSWQSIFTLHFQENWALIEYFFSPARFNCKIRFDPDVFLARALTNDTFAEPVNQSVAMLWVTERPIGESLCCRSVRLLRVLRCERVYFTFSNAMVSWHDHTKRAAVGVEIVFPGKLCWAALCITVAEWFIQPDR